MTERWVVNASPIIVLAKIGHQHLLENLTDELIVPQAVVDEIYQGPADDPARRYLSQQSLKTVPVAPAANVQTWDLGAGETAVLSYALVNSKWRAVIDDGAARRCARALDIPVVGTLGVILRARRLQIIPAAAPLLRQLKESGMHLDDNVIRSALRETVDEEWTG